MIKVVVLGSSNEIGPRSYIAHLANEPDIDLVNLSIGASPSSAGLYACCKYDISKYDYVLISYDINDGGSVYKKITSYEEKAEILLSMISLLQNQGVEPVFIIVPTAEKVGKLSEIEKFYVSFCTQNNFYYINVARCFRELNYLSINNASLLHGELHMGRFVQR